MSILNRLKNNNSGVIRLFWESTQRDGTFLLSSEVTQQMIGVSPVSQDFSPLLSSSNSKREPIGQMSIKTKMYRLAQSGRSMVEMLGVLAIVGVLSIGGIMGYDYAVAKFRANTIMSELNLRAIPISQQLTQHPEEANTALTLEAGDTLSSGQSVSANVAVNPEYFEFHLTEVDDTTCELVLGNYETPAWMMVNGNLYENSTDICSNPDNDMTFVYKNDLGERRNCSSKGFFNLETYKCDCAGGTYFNKDAKDCACPAGHIWSEAERKCIESRCEEGEFEVPSVGCVSCDDPLNYKIVQDETSKSLCKACPNRYLSDNGSSCLASTICEKGTQIPVHFDASSSENACYDCSITGIKTVSNEQAREYCEACINPKKQVIFLGEYRCVAADECSNTGSILGRSKEDSGNLSELACFSCESTHDIMIGHKTVDAKYHEYSKNQCLACKNDTGEIMREVVEEGTEVICRKKICASDEFKGKNGKCYKCTESKAIEVNDVLSCEATSCGRKVIDMANSNGVIQKMCVVSDCSMDGYVKTANGDCYPCDMVEGFKASEIDCHSCGKREDGEPMRGYTSDGYCLLNTCKKNKQYPYVSLVNLKTHCYPCSGNGDGAAPSGTADWGSEYCEACGNYVGSDGYCYVSTSCETGLEFRSGKSGLLAYRFCTSCDYTDKVEMAGHELHDKMCAACVSTRRFFADNYCYRCDSSETPAVKTEGEIKSCQACPNREVNTDGLCVLILTESK